MSKQLESVDVLIIGAGLSGIGSACQLRRNCPDRTFAIFESRTNIGGTWDLFRYPGIRSDSDMYTFSYGFKPWRDASSIADGAKIRRYIQETAAEYDVTRHIHYQHKVVSAHWSSAHKHWTVTALASESGEHVTLTCQFIMSCSGYYDYDEGYTPDFAGTDEFQGQIVHPQHWPDKLDYRDKRVVVIGSGATAITLVPTMAGETASLVMLQRSPTYIADIPLEDPMAMWLRKWLPLAWASRLTRWKKVLYQIYVYRLSRKRPKALRHFLLSEVRKQLGSDYDVKTHFTPRYNPWDQRLCAVPNGDMFSAIREGRAEVVTDHIDRFNREGIQLKSGQQLDADIVIMATGLNLKFAGGVEYQVDNKKLDFTDRFIFRGMMFSDLPNMAFTVGYTNSSWTLKADLTASYVCRLLNKMAKRGYSVVTPRMIGSVLEEHLLDFSACYVLRSQDQVPKQRERRTWKNYQNYIKDFITLRLGGLKDKELEFR